MGEVKGLDLGTWSGCNSNELCLYDINNINPKFYDDILASVAGDQDARIGFSSPITFHMEQTPASQFLFQFFAKVFNKDIILRNLKVNEHNINFILESIDKGIQCDEKLLPPNSDFLSDIEHIEFENVDEATIEKILSHCKQLKSLNISNNTREGRSHKLSLIKS